MHQQTSIFEFLYDKKVITKPIRLIELFAGIGAQFQALKRLTDKVESYKICEWAYNSYCSYNAIHIKDFANYSQGLTKDELVERVSGTSINYNEPLTIEQLNKKPIEWLRNAYNNIVATHNLVNIMAVHGKDLEIVDTDKYEYIMTYSFPCQDLSMAGTRKGMSVSQSEGGTRSGLLWEVERILLELERERELPSILLMENVPEVIGQKNLQDFIKWQNRLEQLGYTNYGEILNAKDYGLPQNRKRFFLISVRGELAYSFPHKMKLKYRLKDFLENEVDEKYYLSEKMIKYITADNELWSGNNNESLVNRSIGCTINTAPANRRCDASNYIADDLPENTDLKLYIKNATIKGYLEAEEGDGIDVSSRMETHRGTVQKGTCQTLTCGGNDVGVVVDEPEK